METRIVARVNDVDIIATTEEQMVPIKPICEALGVNYTTQIEKLKKHPIYGSVVPLRGITAADGKTYQTSCMPLRYISGWILSIHPDNVKEEVREHLIEYQLKCNDVLYDYFFGTYKRTNEQNRMEIALLEQLADYTQQREAANNGIRDTRRKLEKLRQERLADEPQLFG
jgi:hypothetical protein